MLSRTEPSNITGRTSEAALDLVPAHLSDTTARVISLLLVLGGTAAVVWSMVAFWADDQVSGRHSLPFAIGIGSAVFGCMVWVQAWRLGILITAAVIGHASSLQMIDAGRRIHFQQYRPWQDLIVNDTAVFFLFAAQIVVVALIIWPYLAQIKTFLFERIGKIKLAVIFGILAFSGVAVTPDISMYANSLLLSSLVQAVNIANVAALALFIPDSSLQRVKRFLENTFEVSEECGQKPGLDKYSWILAVSVLMLTGFLSYYVYQAHPHVPDETQYLFQANYMAAGQVTSAAPKVPEAFAMYMVPYRDDQWYSIFSPAWPAMLALGTLLGANWLINPFFASICVLLAYIFFQQVYSLKFARVAVLLLSFSPWFIFMAMSYMSHVFTLAFVLGAAVLLGYCKRSGRYSFAFGAGILVGIVSLTRPFDGMIAAMIIGTAFLFTSPLIRQKLTRAVIFAAATLATGALILPYNYAVTGDALLLPMNAYYSNYFWPEVMSLGFGADRGLDWGLDAFPGHSPIEAIINASVNVFSVNIEMFGWATGSLIFVLIFVFSGRLMRRDIWAPAVTAVVVISYGFYWYHGGPDFGARYWFICIIPLIAMTVRGLQVLSAGADGSLVPKLVNPYIAVVVVLCLVTLVSYVPWRSTDKYYRYLEMQPGIRDLAERTQFGKSLVLIRGQEHPDYQSAWIYNSTNFDGDGPIYAFDNSPEVRLELLRNYSDRRVWIVNGPTLANGEYQIAQGPLTPTEAIENMSSSKAE